MYFVCLEHVDIAIDQIVDDEERAPEIVDIEVERNAAGGTEIPATCFRCSEKPQYVVK